MKIKKNNLILLLNELFYLILVPALIFSLMNHAIKLFDLYEPIDGSTTNLNNNSIIITFLIVIMVGLLLSALLYIISRLSLKKKAFKIMLKIYYVLLYIFLGAYIIEAFMIKYHLMGGDISYLVDSNNFLFVGLIILSITVFLSLYNIPKIINKENLKLSKIDFIPMIMNFVFFVILIMVWLLNLIININYYVSMYAYYLYFYIIIFAFSHLLFNIYVIGLLKENKKEAK